MKIGYMKLLLIASEIRVENDELLIALFPDLELRFFSKKLVELYNYSEFEKEFSNIEDSLISPALDNYYSLCNSDIGVRTVMYDTLIGKHKALLREIGKYGELVNIENTVAFIPKDDFALTQENAEMIIALRVKLEIIELKLEICSTIVHRLIEIGEE